MHYQYHNYPGLFPLLSNTRILMVDITTSSASYPNHLSLTAYLSIVSGKVATRIFTSGLNVYNFKEDESFLCSRSYSAESGSPILPVEVNQESPKLMIAACRNFDVFLMYM